MVLRQLIALTAIVVVGSTVSGTVAAADIRFNRDDFTIYLDGEIQRGDAERIVGMVVDADVVASIEVNSMGGDFNEAMRISSLVKDLHLDVYVSQGKLCVSSCFFVWLAGEHRRAAGVADAKGRLESQSNRDSWLGGLGVHRPYFKVPLGMADAPKQQEQMMRKVKEYLVSEGVSQYLIDEMMSHPSNAIYWLNDRDLDAIGEYAPGVEETLIAKCGFKRSRTRILEGWSSEKNRQLNTCVTQAMLFNKIPLFQAYSAKLRKGWRPWKN